MNYVEALKVSRLSEKMVSDLSIACSEYQRHDFLRDSSYRVSYAVEICAHFLDGQRARLDSGLAACLNHRMGRLERVQGVYRVLQVLVSLFCSALGPKRVSNRSHYRIWWPLPLCGKVRIARLPTLL